MWFLRRCEAVDHFFILSGVRQIADLGDPRMLSSKSYFYLRTGSDYRCNTNGEDPRDSRRREISEGFDTDFPARILVKISRAYISFPLGMRTLHRSCGVLMRACSQYFKSFYNRLVISFREVSQCHLCSIVVHSKGSLSHLQQLHTGRVLFSNENNSQIYEHAWKSREKIHWKSPFKRC